MLLHNPHDGSTVPKKCLENRFRLFAQGQWLTLIINGRPQPQATPFRPGTAVIAFQPQQNVSGATTYVMAPPTVAATPVVTSVYPTSTYHTSYPPLPQAVPTATAPGQVYDANTKASYYAQPPVSNIIFEAFIV